MTQGSVIEFKRTSELAVLPTKAHANDACFDLYSAEKVYVSTGNAKIIDTGYNIAIPRGYVGLVCSRSGLASRHGLFVLNAPGVVDSGYRGPLKVILQSTGIVGAMVNIGDRIGQLLLQKVPPATVIEVQEFSDSETSRGEEGFGSTGR